MATGTSGEDGDYGFQIAPMVDIMFVLILFFMTAAMMKQSENELGIKVAGRSSSAAPEAQPAEIQLRIDPNETVIFNDQTIGSPADDKLTTLRNRLKEAIQLFGEKQPVVIIPHSTVKHERVIEVLNACAAANVKNLTFGGGN